MQSRMGGVAQSRLEMVVKVWVIIQTQLISLAADALALVVFGIGHMIYKVIECQCQVISVA
jgi:hypothetical protein